MMEKNKLIVDMILKNATANEIASATGLTNKQLFYRLNMLKMNGYDFFKKYYNDGEITYTINNDIKEKDNNTSIITSSKDAKIDMVLISDLHLTHKLERLDLLNEVYDFCIKEGIHIIINCGDILDGFLGRDEDKKFLSSADQIEYLLKNYPFDKNILNFTCLGNHDYSILKKTGQNLENILLNYRHDIVPLGYGLGKLNIKNDVIMVRHPKTPISNPQGSINNGFIISGHTHEAKNLSDKNLLHIYLPPLSDLKINENTLPGFVRATISFSNGHFCHGCFQQYIFLDKMYKVNESRYNLGSKEKGKSMIINNEEERISLNEKDKKLTKKLK